MTGDLEKAVSAAPGRASAIKKPRQLGRAYLGPPVLDQLLPGGIGYATQLMVIGDTGVGKSVLAAQFLYEGLLVGDACVYAACDEEPDNMRQNMANLRLGTNAYEKAGRLVFIDAFSRGRSRERLHVMDPNNLEEFFAFEKQVLTSLRGATIRLVVDSISTILGTLPRVDVLEFGRARLRYLGGERVLALDNYVTGLLDEQTMAGLTHAYPLILRLGFLHSEAGMQRYLQLGKLRSGMFSGDRRLFRIDPHAGIVGQR